jgi:hypothetical protein
MNLIKSRRNYFKKILCSSNLMALFGVFHVEFDISKSIEGGSRLWFAKHFFFFLPNIMIGLSIQHPKLIGTISSCSIFIQPLFDRILHSCIWWMNFTKISTIVYHIFFWYLYNIFFKKYVMLSKYFDWIVKLRSFKKIKNKIKVNLVKGA